MLQRIVWGFSYISIVFFALSVYTSASGLGASSVAAIVATFLFYVNKNNWKKIKLPKSSICLLVLVGVGILSFVANYSEAAKPIKMLSKLKYYLLAGLWLPVLKEFVQNLKPNGKVYLARFIVYSLLITITIAGVYGYIQNPNARSHGLIGIMRFSYTLALLSPIVWHYALARESKIVPTCVWWLFLIIILASIVTTGARGGMIGFILGFFISCFFHHKKAFISFVILAFIVSIGLYVAKVNGASFMQHRYFQKLNSSSNLMRISYYKSALYAISERPLLGFGMKRFPSQIGRIKKEYKLPYVWAQEHSHSVILEMAAQIGIIGLISFLAWIFFWGKEMVTPGKSALFFPFIIVFLVIGQLDYILFTNNMLLTFAFYHLSFILPAPQAQHKVII